MDNGIIASSSPKKAAPKTSVPPARAIALQLPENNTNTLSNFRASGRTSMSEAVSPSRREEAVDYERGEDFIEAAGAANRQRPECPNSSVQEIIEPNIFAAGNSVSDIPIVPTLSPAKKADLDNDRDNADSGVAIKTEPLEQPAPVNSSPELQQLPKRQRTNQEPPLICLSDSEEEALEDNQGENVDTTNLSTQSIERVTVKEEPLALDLSITKDPISTESELPPTQDPDDLIEQLMDDDDEEFERLVDAAESDFVNSQSLFATEAPLTEVIEDAAGNDAEPSDAIEENEEEESGE